MHFRTFRNLHINDGMRRLACAVAVTVVVAAGAEAQGRADAVYITLSTELCTEFRHVVPGQDDRLLSVVTNESDVRFPAERVPGSECKWRFELQKRQNLDISRFSLRLGGLGRTLCKRAERHGSEFRLVFEAHGKTEARALQIEPGSFDYIREVTDENNGNSPCREEGSVHSTLHDVQFDIENVHLQIFERKAVACGVMLDDVTVLDKAKKGDVVEVTSKELAPVVVKQGLQGKNCYAPTLTPPEALEQSLRGKARFNITVK